MNESGLLTVLLTVYGVECPQKVQTNRTLTHWNRNAKNIVSSNGNVFPHKQIQINVELEYPTDIVLLVVLWQLRYKLSLRDLAEMFLERGFEFTHEAVRDS